MRVAIIGTGNIGMDLAMKVRRSDSLELVMLAGQRLESPGIQHAISLDIPCSARGAQAIGEAKPDLLFDATDAVSHKMICSQIESHTDNLKVVNLTPGCGHSQFPTLGIQHGHTCNSLVTCGAQASVPLVHAFSQQCSIQYAEVASTISSRSAGPATRSNISEYIEATQRALMKVGGASDAKAILILNPCDPPMCMRTTIYIKPSQPRAVTGVFNGPDGVRQDLRDALAMAYQKIQDYVPGYEWDVPPHKHGDHIMMTVRVEGAGDWLPPYAGNLDIITSAAVQVAEELAK